MTCKFCTPYSSIPDGTPEKFNARTVWLVWYMPQEQPTGPALLGVYATWALAQAARAGAADTAVSTSTIRVEADQ